MGGIMLAIDIPGFGLVRLEHLVSDFSGTLSSDGKIIPGVRERLEKISKIMKVHILSADTFGSARKELLDIMCVIHILSGRDNDIQKENYVKKLGVERVVALGNGNNDRKMLKTARLGIAVAESEGCAVDAILAADIHVHSALDGLDLLLNPKRCKATLRF
jgi:soluble P-type ATPase